MTLGLSIPVAHVAEDMAPISGGVPAVVRQLSRRLASAGSTVTVLHAKGSADDLQPDVQVRAAVPSRIGNVLSHGPTLSGKLSTLLAELHRQQGLMHIHGVWSAPQLMASSMAVATGVPTLLSVHGMLEPWLWNQQGAVVRWKKQLFWQLVAARRLKLATVVHAITPLEQRNLSRLFPGNRVEVIPNAIEMTDATKPLHQRDRSILFLGRIEPKKGVDILIRSFSIAKLGPDWVLDIVGPSWSDEYLHSLKALSASLGVASRVRFHGAVFGDEKNLFLSRAWVMAAPSHSEVVGLVNLEAAAWNLPSITTHQTGLSDWLEGGGILVQPDANELATALAQAGQWSDREQADRGIASRQLVARRYSWNAVMPQWIEIYEELSRRGYGHG